MFSPEHETFSTPPSSPMPTIDDHNILDRPSLSRRSSRPSNLRIQQSLSDWKPDIVLDNGQSPDASTLMHGAANQAATTNKGSTPLTAVPLNSSKPAMNGDSRMTNGLAPAHPVAIIGPKSPRPPHPQQAIAPMRSPCFVHSQLQGPSFTEWLKVKQQKASQESRIDGPPKVVEDVHHIGQGYQNGIVSSPRYEEGYYQHEEDEEETAGSLTKQLAETAVGVREMSKQLGKSHVGQSGAAY